MWKWPQTKLLGTTFGLLLSGISGVLVPDAIAQQPAGVLDVPTAAGIMARVGANQDRAEDERSHYVYLQHARVISRKGKTVMCEEITDSRVTPSSSASKAELLKLDGRMLVKHKYVTYTKLPAAAENGSQQDKTQIEAEQHSLTIELSDDETDRDLVEHMRANLTRDESKDGVNGKLFPLTTKSQADYTFQLLGREHMNGREVFHLTFQPKEKNEYGWKGDAYVDVSVYEPVAISTDMARKVPIAVRTLLGTSVPGLGFTVVYAPQPDGVWFPVNLSTEFKLHVLFFFSREIIMNAQNTAFEKTHVETKILSADVPAPASDSPH